MARLRLEPEGLEVPAAVGASVLDAGLDAGLDLPFGCLSAKCGVCRVEVLAGAESGLEPASDLEQVVLAGFHCPPGVRLACQARVAGDVTVRSLHPREDEPEEPGALDS